MKRMVVLAAVAALQLACSGTNEQPGGRIAIRSEALAADASVTRVVVELQPSGAINELTKDSSGSWVGTVVAPEGPQTVTVRAYAGDVLVAEGSAEVLVVAGQTAVAVVVMHEVGGPPPADHGPIIRSLTSTLAALVPGQHATLAVDALDPDGDALSYQWSRSCPTGVFGNPTAATTEFWSDAEAGCTVTVAVSSGGFTATRSISLVVQSAGPSGQVEVSASYVAFPYVDLVYVYDYKAPDPYWEYMISRTLTSYCTYCGVTANATLPIVYFPAQTQTFSVRFANLPPGDPNLSSDLHVWMDDDCGGSTTWDGTIWNGNEAIFTWKAPPVAGLCMVTPHVSYQGMQDALPLAALVDGCIDDRLERSSQYPYPQNDDPAGATDLYTLSPRVAGVEYPNAGEKLPSYSATGLWANDADWFKFTVAPATTSTLLSAVLASSDVIPVELFAADGTTSIAAADGTLEVTVTPGAAYLLKVGPGASAASCGAAYGIELWLKEPTP